jgi:hypothetical protein
VRESPPVTQAALVGLLVLLLAAPAAASFMVGGTLDGALRSADLLVLARVDKAERGAKTMEYSLAVLDVALPGGVPGQLAQATTLRVVEELPDERVHHSGTRFVSLTPGERIVASLFVREDGRFRFGALVGPVAARAPVEPAAGTHGSTWVVLSDWQNNGFAFPAELPVTLAGEDGVTTCNGDEVDDFDAWLTWEDLRAIPWHSRRGLHRAPRRAPPCKGGRPVAGAPVCLIDYDAPRFPVWPTAGPGKRVQLACTGAGARFAVRWRSVGFPSLDRGTMKATIDPDEALWDLEGEPAITTPLRSSSVDVIDSGSVNIELRPADPCFRGTQEPELDLELDVCVPAGPRRPPTVRQATLRHDGRTIELRCAFEPLPEASSQRPPAPLFGAQCSTGPSPSSAPSSALRSSTSPSSTPAPRP